MNVVSKKKKIKIDGNQHKVDDNVYNLLKVMNETIHSHEIAILTWIHRIYNEKKRHNVDEKMLYEYAVKIPNAFQIIDKMKELDKKEEEKENKETKETVENTKQS